jgi:hypothetical protein
MLIKYWKNMSFSSFSFQCSDWRITDSASLSQNRSRSRNELIGIQRQIDTDDFHLIVPIIQPVEHFLLRSWYIIDRGRHMATRPSTGTFIIAFFQYHWLSSIFLGEIEPYSQAGVPWQFMSALAPIPRAIIGRSQLKAV